jgi:hypothetical protein
METPALVKMAVAMAMVHSETAGRVIQQLTLTQLAKTVKTDVAAAAAVPLQTPPRITLRVVKVAQDLL